MALTPSLVSGSSAKRPEPSGINAMPRVHKNSTGQLWGRAERRAAELNNLLRHRIDMAVELGPEAVNHLVQRDEVRALYVPMRLLGQQRQIDRVCEPGVED